METSSRLQQAQDEDSLAGRVALVTGGTRGIGAATSTRLRAVALRSQPDSPRTPHAPSSSVTRSGTVRRGRRSTRATSATPATASA